MPVGQDLVIDLVRGFAGQRGVRNLVKVATRRLAGKVVQQAGRTGEHYVARDFHEWRLMGYGALGAGAITAFTALAKYAISALHEAPLLVGVGHAINYSLSFILMQFCGFLLASKMPAATGAALAHSVEHADDPDSRLRLIASITRTQLIVTLGNIFGAIPMSLLVDRLWIRSHGEPFLSSILAEGASCT